MVATALAVGTGVAGAGTAGRAATRRAASPPSALAGYTVVESAPIPLPAQKQTKGSVTCPAGTKPLSGGAYDTVGNLNTDINSSYPTSGGSWTVRMNNDVAESSSMLVYAVCAKRPSTRFTVVTQQATVSAGQQGYGSAVCASGVAVGGGVLSSSRSTSVKMNSNFPGGTTRWDASMNNDSASDAGFTVYAICQNAKPKGYSLQIGATTELNPFTNSLVGVTCPGSSVPLSGGISASDTNHGANINSSWPNTKDWSNYYNDNSASSEVVLPYAVCAGT